MWIELLHSNMDELASSALGAARSALSLGEPEEAISLANRALEISAQVYGKMAEAHVRAMTISARALIRVGRLEEAEKQLRDASLIAYTHHATNSQLVHRILMTWADVLARLGRYESAEETAEQELDAAKKCGVDKFVHDAENHLREIRALRERSS